MRELLDEATSREISEVLSNPANRPVTALLATLVASGAMEIKIAYRPGRAGIFHAKIGVMSDGDAAISFSGSSNETFSAWDVGGNYESFEVFTSWTDGAARVANHGQRFERLWEGVERGVETVSFPEAARRSLLEHQDDQGTAHALREVRASAESRLSGTRDGIPVVAPPTRRTLMEHQVDVLDGWETAARRGIVKHATGAGKTVTALEAIRRWIADSRPAIVVVPSEILVGQWNDEAELELGDGVAVLQAGAGVGASEWSEELADLTRSDVELGPRLTIATVQTASSDAFIRLAQGGDHLLLIADEVHRLGARTLQRVMEIEAGGRLGLSATPERFGDPAGTQAIFGYFGEILHPEFGLADAIRVGRLVPYDYYVHEVALEPWEQEEWDAATGQIRQAYARLPVRDGTKLLTDAFKLMLIERARIAKKAASESRSGGGCRHPALRAR